MPRVSPSLLVGALGALAALWTPAEASAQDPEAVCENGFADVYPCSAVDLLARVTFAQLGAPGPGTCGPYPELCLNEVWGWTDPETEKDYALVGLANGVAFVDLTEPTSPVVLGRLPTATSTTNWRTLRVYQDHVFVGSEAGAHGVQVFDLTRLRDVISPPTLFTADARYTGNANAHTLDINEATGYLYIAGGSGAHCGGGLHMVDVRNPTAPVFAGCFDDDGYTHEAQCLTYDGPDADYTGREICAAYNEDTVTFVDVTDKANPELISRGLYPNAGYTHQGWFTDDKRYILLDDEFDPAVPGTRTIVMDVEDLDNPSYVFSYAGTTGAAAHNLYIRGDFAYLSNYTAGLRILDISGIDGGTFEEAGYFDTYPGGDDFDYAGQWMNYPFFASGIVLANDGANGLFVLRPTFDIVAADPRPLPAGFALSAPAPNPARDRAALSLTVERAQTVRAEAFDALGRRVAVLYDGPAAAGAVTELVLEAAGLVPGPYLVRVTGETFATDARLSIAR
jgi:choice-of-anchor B domain-containing protein